MQNPKGSGKQISRTISGRAYNNDPPYGLPAGSTPHGPDAHSVVTTIVISICKESQSGKVQIKCSIFSKCEWDLLHFDNV